jgi:Domain of unknown function (DUF4105)
VKKILLRTLFICIFAHLHICTFAQDSSRLRISLLTCTPGQELNETFGHSAIRVIDSNSVTDHVYNYGTFDFEDKNFYIKFIKGKLRYFVNIDQFQEFAFFYQQYNRGITEQVLNLSEQEKLDIYHALIENAKEENKYYQYDFFLDNCTTRLRDIIKKYHNPTPFLPAVMPTSYSFRNAIHKYLDDNNQYWSKLGIDILLGARTDAIMTAEQQQFLPDNLMHALDSTTNTKVVSTSNQLYIFNSTKNKSSFFTPLFLSSAVLLFFILLSLFKNNFSRKLLKFFDVLLFVLVGALGILLIFMWFGTDHIMTKNNYNLLWASPLFIVYAFFVNKNTSQAKRISLFVCIYLLLILCSWFFLPQLMNNGLLPIVALLAWRSFSHSRKYELNEFSKS